MGLSFIVIGEGNREMAFTETSATNGSYFRIVIVTVASTAINVFSAVADTCARVGRYMRGLFLDEPLRFFDPIEPSCLPAIDGERVAARSAAPVARFEPAFVGAGLAFRRWR